MQTFLPYPDFGQSAHCLDDKRLGKQRVECQIILNTLLGEKVSWSNHPVVKMWRGFEPILIEYSIIICKVWIGRGFNDSLLSKFIGHLGKQLSINNPKPSWLGLEIFHSSHRSNLLRKDPIWYGQFNWTEPNNLPYYWPI